MKTEEEKRNDREDNVYLIKFLLTALTLMFFISVLISVPLGLLAIYLFMSEINKVSISFIEFIYFSLHQEILGYIVAYLIGLFSIVFLWLLIRKKEDIKSMNFYSYINRKP